MDYVVCTIVIIGTTMSPCAVSLMGCSSLQYLLRDIIQFDGSLQEAMQRISTAHRTCDLILGVGDWEVRVVLCTCLFLLQSSFFDGSHGFIQDFF